MHVYMVSTTYPHAPLIVIAHDAGEALELAVRALINIGFPVNPIEDTFMCELPVNTAAVYATGPTGEEDTRRPGEVLN